MILQVAVLRNHLERKKEIRKQFTKTKHLSRFISKKLKFQSIESI